jgi:hypothetical protein
MNCDEYQQKVSEFIDEELDSREIRMLFTHLGSCDACWRYYRRIERLHATMGSSALDRRTAEKETSIENDPAGGSIHRNNTGLKARPPMSLASFLLGSYVAFAVGILLTLLLLPAKDNLQPHPEDAFGPLHHQLMHGNSHTGPDGVQFSPWRQR